MVTSENFNSKLRDELRNSKVFYSLAEAQVVIESWRRLPRQLQKSLCSECAVDRVHRACDEACLRPGEPRHHPGDLLRPSVALQRHEAVH
jgi:hypothetical protein